MAITIQDLIDAGLVLTELAPGDYILAKDISEALDSQEWKAITYKNLVPKSHTIGVPMTAPQAAVTVGEGINYFPIPADWDGWSLVEVHGSVSTKSSSGKPTIQVYNLTTGHNMLSTPVTIDVNEYTSYTAAIPSVVNATYKVVSKGDIIRLDVPAGGAGTGAKGMTAILTVKEE